MSDEQYSKVWLIFPVLFMEYLSITLVRSLIPRLVLDYFGGHAYVAIGVVEMVKGCLAFLSCPLLGRISDTAGRKYCLLISVCGTCLPVCLLFLTGNTGVFMVAIALSGFVSATFGLTFAYISDCVPSSDRAVMYGYALATFGLSLSIGPLAGGYLVRHFDHSFIYSISVFLAVLDVAYILLFLPETKADQKGIAQGVYSAFSEMYSSWSITSSMTLLKQEKLLRNLAVVMFLYYISVYALVSTFMIYATRQLHFDQLGIAWLMSCYGSCTMISETMLVKPIIHAVGELNTIRLGLGAFALQCFLFSLSASVVAIYASFLLSMLSSLVYPTVCSLLANNMDGLVQGESLGVLNGIKALTEGLGPLFFGGLMGLFENSSTPSVPYAPAGMLVLWALLHSYEPEFSASADGKGTISSSRDVDAESEAGERDPLIARP